MKKLYIVLLLSVIAIAGCDNVRRSIPMTKKTLSAYEDIKRSYPEWLVDFFPDVRKGKVVYMHLLWPRGSHLSHIHLVMEYNSEKVAEIRREAIAKAKRIYTFQDSSLLVLNYSPESIKHFKNLNFEKDIEDTAPTPNFDFLRVFAERTLKYYGETVDYENEGLIIVLGYGNDVLFDKKFLSSDCAGLSERWQHGYTKGMVIWDSFVAYWLEVW
jgi:hypothetical protein